MIDCVRCLPGPLEGYQGPINIGDARVSNERGEQVPWVLSPKQ
jgi:hypothetical protein